MSDLVDRFPAYRIDLPGFQHGLPVIFSDDLYNDIPNSGSSHPVSVTSFQSAFLDFISLYNLNISYKPLYLPWQSIYEGQPLPTDGTSYPRTINSYDIETSSVMENIGLPVYPEIEPPARSGVNGSLITVGDSNIGNKGSTYFYVSYGSEIGTVPKSSGTTIEYIQSIYARFRTALGGSDTGWQSCLGGRVQIWTKGTGNTNIDWDNLYSASFSVGLGLVLPKSDFILDDPNNKYVISGEHNPKTVIFSVQLSSSGSLSARIQGATLYEPDLTNTQVWIDIDPLSGGLYSGSSAIGIPGVQPDGTNAGGDGTFTLQDDDVPESPLPSASSSIIGAGCGTAYCDTGLNVRSLMSYMWTHADDIIANLKKIIANPIDAILGLHIVPVVPTVGGAQEVYLGNVGSGVSMTPITTPYLRYRLGSLVINKYWGSALDFNPFTQFSIHLPYIGFRQLNTDDLMGSTCELYYDIDVISGACVAHLKVTRTDPLTKETHTVDQYSWPGNCAMQIPVTSTNYQGLYSAIFNSVVAVASGIAGAAVGGLIGAGGEVAGKTLATGIAHTATNTANNLFNGGSKIRVEKSGNLSGVHGFLGSQYAFIERVTPRQSLASVYREVLGYPSNTTQVLGTCTGFTQIEEINLENFSCTADEKDELERLLKGGVIF